MKTSCDFCDTEYDMGDRKVLTQIQPSSPDTLVGVMWGCGSCDESRDLPTPFELEMQVERGELGKIAFLIV